MKVVLLCCLFIFFSILSLVSVFAEERYDIGQYYSWSEEKQDFDVRTRSILVPSSKDPRIGPSEPASFTSSSQVGQDVILTEIFDKIPGFFVDLAANHWIELSNSFALEHYYHWKGICIEPNPEYLGGLLTNRKCSVFVNPVGDGFKKISFEARGVNSGISGVMDQSTQEHKLDQVITLTTVPLQKILDYIRAPPIIHFFSLDVEGSEVSVLKSFDFSKYTFLVITIERPTLEVHHLLTKQGYIFIRQLGNFGECLYFHHSIKDINWLYKKYFLNNYSWFGLPNTYLAHPEWKGNEFLQMYLKYAKRDPRRVNHNNANDPKQIHR